MKSFMAFAATAVLASSVLAQDLPRVSQKSTFTQAVGLSEISVTYSRPAVRGRAIWGSLVPFDQVWRTGANEATTFRISDDAKINGQALKAGTYSLHTVPSKDAWTVIFNSVADQWGSYSYKQESDALRVKVAPKSAEFTELLTFEAPRVTQNSADVQIRWEKVAVPFTVEFDTNAKAIANIEKAISEKPSDWRPYYRGAVWANDNGVSDRATQWLQKARSIEENWQTMSLQAKMLARSGDRKGAIAAGQKALDLAAKMEQKPDTTEMTGLMAEWKK